MSKKPSKFRDRSERFEGGKKNHMTVSDMKEERKPFKIKGNRGQQKRLILQDEFEK